MQSKAVYRHLQFYSEMWHLSAGSEGPEGDIPDAELWPNHTSYVELSGTTDVSGWAGDSTTLTFIKEFYFEDCKSSINT